jgi:hypothetical protein
MVGFLERFPARCTPMGPGMTRGGCSRFPASALVRRLLSVGRGELDFKLMDLVPLGVGSPALRYREKLLQASPRRLRLWSVHGGIIPLFDTCGRVGARAGRPCRGRRPSGRARAPGKPTSLEHRCRHEQRNSGRQQQQQDDPPKTRVGDPPVKLEPGPRAGQHQWQTEQIKLNSLGADVAGDA